MRCRFSDLRYKEVINVNDGFRMGYVCDIALNAVTGQILSILIPGQSKFFGFFGREDDFCIPWECIRRIGEDIILVDIDGEYKREKRTKRN